MGFLSGILGARNDTQVRKPVNNFQATSPIAAPTLQAGNAQAQGGAGPASDTIARQNLLNDQLTAAANGTGGPSPAQQMLQQQTGRNINTAAAQVAGTRGTNPALAARMAVDAGSGMNQEAAGQAATMKAQEQIAARQQLQGNLAATAGTELGQQEAGAQLLGTAGGLDLGAQGLNEQVAAQNAGLDLGAQQLEAGVAGQNAATNAKIAGGAVNAVGGFLGLDEGGEVPDMPAGQLHAYLDTVHTPSAGEQFGTPVFGEQIQNLAPVPSQPLPNSPALSEQAPGAGASKPSTPLSTMGDAISEAGPAGQAAFRDLTARPVHGAIYANGGSIHRPDVMLSPGEKVAPPGTTPSDAARIVRSAPPVPGQASVSGDSPRNDVVHARVPAGSIVLPRSVVHAKNPGKAASSFVASVLKRGQGKSSGGRVDIHKENAGPGPASHIHDLSQGGMVPGGKSALKSEAKGSTARGLGREKHRSRLTSSGSAPRFKERD